MVSKEVREIINSHIAETNETFVMAENAMKEPGKIHDRLNRLFEDFWAGFNSDDSTLVTHVTAIRVLGLT